METVYYRFVLRCYTAAEFSARNDILLDRELGVEYDTGRCKRGDGSTPWNDLPYEVLGLGEVDWSALADGDALLFDADTGTWKTGTPTVDLAAITHAATDKATPADADELPLVDSAESNVLKNLTWANLKATLKTYFDTLYAAAGSAGAWSMVKKTADESRNTTTTFANDSALTVALAASTLYHVRGRIFFAPADSASGFKFQFVYSGTTTTVRSYRHNVAASTSGSATSGTDLTTSTLPSGAGTFVESGGGGLAFTDVVMAIRTNSAGTLSFQWAQNVSNALNATVCEGSYLEYAAF